jgi:hypothetical protein
MRIGLTTTKSGGIDRVLPSGVASELYDTGISEMS